MSSPLTFHVFSCRPQTILPLSYFKALTALHLTCIKVVLSDFFQRRHAKAVIHRKKPCCSLQLASQQPVQHGCQAAGLRVEFATVCVLCLCTQSCEEVIDQQSSATSHISTVRSHCHYSIFADIPSASHLSLSAIHLGSFKFLKSGDGLQLQRQHWSTICLK